MKGKDAFSEAVHPGAQRTRTLLSSFRVQLCKWSFWCLLRNSSSFSFRRELLLLFLWDHIGDMAPCIIFSFYCSCCYWFWWNKRSGENWFRTYSGGRSKRSWCKNLPGDWRQGTQLTSLFPGPLTTCSGFSPTASPLNTYTPLYYCTENSFLDPMPKSRDTLAIFLKKHSHRGTLSHLI